MSELSWNFYIILIFVQANTGREKQKLKVGKEPFTKKKPIHRIILSAEQLL